MLWYNYNYVICASIILFYQKSSLRYTSAVPQFPINSSNLLLKNGEKEQLLKQCNAIKPIKTLPINFQYIDPKQVVENIFTNNLFEYTD